MTAEHDPSGWWQPCTLNIIDDRGRVIGICNVQFWTQWIPSEHKGRRQPHECRAELALHAAIVAQQLDEVKP